MYISLTKRTPIGKKNGVYSNETVIDLGSFLISRMACEFSIMPSNFALGCSLQAGCGQNIAKNILNKARIPMNISSITLNKSNASGVSAILYGFQSMLASNSIQSFLCASVESCSMAPNYFHPSDSAFKNHLTYDALTDYSSNKLLYNLVENLIAKNQIKQEELDKYKFNSLENYEINKYKQKKNMIPYELNEVMIYEDEDNITQNFNALNADCAAGVLLTKNKTDKTSAKILGIAEYAGHSSSFAEACIFSTNKLLQSLNLKKDDIKLFEVDETFAAIPCAFMKNFCITQEKTNKFGGSLSSGNTIAVAGMHMLMNLINALEEQGGGIGIVSLSVGGGEGISLAIEV